MGRVKALLQLAGETFIDRLIRVFGTRCDPVIVVAGHHALQIADGSARALEARWVLNPRPDRGQFSSLQCGVRTLPDTIDGFCFCPVDVPAFAESTLDALIAAFEASDAAVYRPRHGERRGHPVVVRRAVIEAMLTAPAESSAKEVLAAHAGAEIVVDDPAVLFDVDEPGDYRQLVSMRPGDV